MRLAAGLRTGRRPAVVGKAPLVHRYQATRQHSPLRARKRAKARAGTRRRKWAFWRRLRTAASSPEPRRVFMISIRAGAFALIRTVEPGLPNNRLNDGAVDPRGRLWFGSMDDEEREPSGMLYRFDRGSLTAMDSGYVITNGPAFSPDGTHALSHRHPGAADLRLRPGAKTARWPTSVSSSTIEDGAGYPDGPVVDGEGCLWTGLFGGWAGAPLRSRWAAAGERRFSRRQCHQARFRRPRPHHSLCHHGSQGTGSRRAFVPAAGRRAVLLRGESARPAAISHLAGKRLTASHQLVMVPSSSRFTGR